LRETRRITIADKVFTANDLWRLATILEKQRALAKGTEQHFEVSFSIAFENRITREADSPEILTEEELNASSRPIAVEMSFNNFTLKRSVSIRLMHGNFPSFNTIVVSGSESRWLNRAFSDLQEAIARVAPQKVWLARYQVILTLLIALFMGHSVSALLKLFVDLLVRYSHPVTVAAPTWIHQIFELIAASPVISILLSITWRLVLGMSWGAPALTSWIISLWPSVEFDFGLEHVKVEKSRRKKLAIALSLIVLPLLISEAVAYFNK